MIDCPRSSPLGFTIVDMVPMYNQNLPQVRARARATGHLLLYGEQSVIAHLEKIIGHGPITYSREGVVASSSSPYARKRVLCVGLLILLRNRGGYLE